MENIYSFSKKFLEKEAEIITRKRVPDLDSYNYALQEYFSFLVEKLHGATGHMPMTELDSEEEYEMMEGYPDDTPRQIFKISEYYTSQYGTVWVIFVSERNFKESFKQLESAFIVIKESGELKIAKFLLFNNYTESGDLNARYRWDDMWGYPDLNFETLKNPVKIDRYLEPSDSQEGLDQYNASI